MLLYKLLESYGTGIGKICRMYDEEHSQPQFDTAKPRRFTCCRNCVRKSSWFLLEKAEAAIMCR